MSCLSSTNNPRALEMWGGVECSIVRIGNRERNQLRMTGHEQRTADLDHFAALGLKTLRYPILWERHANPSRIDWSWADERLHRLRELGIRPVIGFMHHGCGPLPGGLLDPRFVSGLADFAQAVAERYPWLDAYTPINEPGTTARFSGLYGLWHPHGHDVATFGRCFLNECLAIREAMKRIRAINPTAQLIQTEDLGKTHSTPRLAYQAAYENERRWLTFDVLCGRLAPNHLVHTHLLECGVPEKELESFVIDPCPPDVLGINHYVTSERFLDERLERYPAWTHGGNRREAYADLDAVRVRAEGLLGLGRLLHEAWDRFRRPIAITEVQLACTREEQLRWIVECWAHATTARAAGVEVCAMTAWSLLGSFDWDSLLTQTKHHYENGAYDIRGPLPRLTEVGRAVARLAETGDYTHPVLEQPGWWRRPVRLEYPPVTAPLTGPGTALAIEPRLVGRPVLILGAGGTLGRAFQRLCILRGLPAVGFRRAQLDVTRRSSVAGAVQALRPWAVINCAGYIRIEDAERFPDDCRRANVDGASTVAALCAEEGLPLATFSSDFVFDGQAGRPYSEDDLPNPLNQYGRSKHAAEQSVAQILPTALIVRTSAFFGPWDDYNFVTRTARLLTEGHSVRVARQGTVTPTYVPDLVNATLDLLIDGESGIWHLANQGGVSWLHWAYTIADSLGVPRDRIIPSTSAEVGWHAPRPTYSALTSVRGSLLRPWDAAFEKYLAAVYENRSDAAA